MLEVEVDGDTEVIVNTNVEVIAGNMNVAIIEDTNDIEVTVNRQEYVITGDEIYIPKRFEDAPTWMQQLITQVVDTSISAQIQDLNEISMSLESMIDAMEVAKNTYELSIISSNDIDQRINTAVTTLNSSMEEADATILEVAQTRTTPEEAATIAIDVISAQLGSTDAGTIGASVSELQTAIANEEEARSTSLETLASSIEGAFDVNATAMNYLNTYVGLDEAGASTGTGLSGYLEGTDGQIGSAGSQLINDIELKAGEVESKFAYNSTVKLNGVTHTSGFGIATTIDSENIPEGESQFWISADEFKIVGANQTAEAQGPFTVNTTTGDITFNGEVTFNAVDAVYADTIVDNTANNNDVFAQRLGYMDYADMVAAATSGQTIINGGYLRGGLIEANSINAGQIDAYAIVGKYISGGTITGTQIIGSVIKGSFIDLTSSLALTNWQYYTPATIPVGYEQNFAHTNEGDLVVDSQGYVRLAGQQNFIIPTVVQTGTLWNGSLSNVTTYPSITINKVWEIYSWNEYKVDTLQRSIQNNTQFSSNSSLVFKGEIVCDSPLGGSGTDVNNYGIYSIRFLDTDILISIQASNGNQHNAEITDVQFNGITVAYADGRFGETPETDPSDSAFVDYSTVIKGVPVNVKTTFTGMAGYTFVFTATISNNTIIPNHTIDDVIRVNSVSHSLNTANSSVAGQTLVTYEMNFPSTWVV